MGFNCGIVGLPNVGKSTLFNAITNTTAAAAANYPFCTIEPNVGRVPVPDARLDGLAALARSARIIPTQLEIRENEPVLLVDPRGEDAFSPASVDHFELESGMAWVAPQCLDAFFQRVDQSSLTPPLLHLLQEGRMQIKLVDASDRTLIRYRGHILRPRRIRSR